MEEKGGSRSSGTTLRGQFCAHLSLSLSLFLSSKKVPPRDDGCALARECAKTKILRAPSRRAQRALVRVAPAVRKLEPRECSGAHCRALLAARNEEIPVGEWPCARGHGTSKRRGRERKERSKGGWKKRAVVRTQE